MFWANELVRGQCLGLRHGTGRNAPVSRNTYPEEHAASRGWIQRQRAGRPGGVGFGPGRRLRVQTSWRDRLQTRPDAVGASHYRTKATNTQTEKPLGIVKRSKASKKKRPATTKRQTTTSTAQTADPSHPGAQSQLNESVSQAVPGSVTKARGTNLRRRSPRQASAAQPQGVQKARNGNRRQTRRLIAAALTANGKQELLHIFTPPQSK